MSALDRIDYQILRALQKNGRLSNKELAAEVGLAPSSCLSRVRGLRADGVLGEVHTDVSRRAAGVALEAMVSVRLRTHERDAFASFRAYVLELEELVALYQLSGADDFMAHVAVRDADHLRAVTMDAFAVRREIGHIETSIIFGVDRRRLPIYEH